VRIGCLAVNLRLQCSGDATNFFVLGRYTESIKASGVVNVVIYVDVVLLLNFLVDLLLLAGTNRLAGYCISWRRSALAAAFGGGYASLCVLPQLQFLGNCLWRMVSFSLMSVIAFGWKRSALRRGVLFVLLSMALGGVAVGLGKGGFVGLVMAAGVLCGMCLFGFHGGAGQAEFVPVLIKRRQACYRLTALRDTGNSLRDPVTGEQVLVVSSDVAWDILGLTPQQLRTPIETMREAQIPGLRLIPYRAVGQPGGMLLAAAMDSVEIGGKRAGRLVAFAPDKLGTDEAYEALAGGVL